jgi:hypothetical protein
MHFAELHMVMSDAPATSNRLQPLSGPERLRNAALQLHM